MLAAAAVAAALVAGACASGRGRAPSDGGELSLPGEPGTTAAPARRGGAAGAPIAELAAIWRRMGLVVPRGDLPFVGTVAYLAGRTADSTLALVTLSLPARALSFVREGDRYRAGYRVHLEVRGTAVPGSPAPLVRQVDAEETVRVATFKETARTEESILFAQWLALPPGRLTLHVAVRDVEGSRSASADSVALVVPRLGAGGVATPVVAHQAVPRDRLEWLPRLLPSPRGSAVFGQDSVLSVYVEAYGSATGAERLPVTLAVRGDRAQLLWRDTASLARRGDASGTAARDASGDAARAGGTSATPTAGAAARSAPALAPTAATTGPWLYGGVVRVPVARLGIGVATLQVTRRDVADSARAPLFVSLGDELPVATFEEMVGYLRYYATPERLRTLRDSVPERRAAAWATFLRESDPITATAVHEGLRDYFGRLRTANARFREDGAAAGWLTDRGMAYVALGEPDQIVDPNPADQTGRGRQQLWQYGEARLSLAFVDQSGTGRWRLTPASANEVQAALRQRMVP